MERAISDSKNANINNGANIKNYNSQETNQFNKNTKLCANVNEIKKKLEYENSNIFNNKFDIINNNLKIDLEKGFHENKCNNLFNIEKLYRYQDSESGNN